MAFQGWENGRPPRTWKRILAMDVGGATANALNQAAICPDTQSLVFEGEVHKVTTDMAKVAEETKPLLKPEGSNEKFEYIAMVGDYENRIALADMAKHGIPFTNAVKHDKIISVHRLAGYLHPNPKRPFPLWHPRAGELGAPLMFILPMNKHLIEEIPLQKWKEEGKGDSVKDELDRTVKHDHVDCALYIARVLPAPATIPIPQIAELKSDMSLQSRLYWADVKRMKEAKSNTETRTPYNPAHTGGDKWKSLLGSF